jgi:anti-sigma factor RsiW
VSEHRGWEDDLVELALGEVAEPRRSELLSHLTGCLRCRTAYGELVDAIDATVPAAPEVQPPAGFDARVLTAIGIESPGPVQRLTRHASSRVLLAAAAVVLVALAAVFGATALLGDRDATQVAAPPGALPEGTTVLTTGDGERVGTAALAWMHESRVLVVAVSDAPVGVQYSCRVRLAEGNARVLGRWEASSAEGGTWVMPAPQGDLNAIELVTDSGHIWSSAQLP